MANRNTGEAILSFGLILILCYITFVYITRFTHTLPNALLTVAVVWVVDVSIKYMSGLENTTLFADFSLSHLVFMVGASVEKITLGTLDDTVKNLLFGVLIGWIVNILFASLVPPKLLTDFTFSNNNERLGVSISMLIVAGTVYALIYLEIQGLIQHG